MKLSLFMAMIVGFAATPAFAQNDLSPRGMTITEMHAALEANDATVTVVSENQLNVQTWGYSYLVAGFNCQPTNRCTEFLFETGYDLPNGFPLNLINEWNAKELAGRAYLDGDGDPFLDHAISVSGPGDTAVVYEGLLLWLNALVEFNTFLEENQASI